MGLVEAFVDYTVASLHFHQFFKALYCMPVFVIALNLDWSHCDRDSTAFGKFQQSLKPTTEVRWRVGGGPYPKDFPADRYRL